VTLLPLLLVRRRLDADIDFDIESNDIKLFSPTKTDSKLLVGVLVLCTSLITELKMVAAVVAESPVNS